MAARALIVDDNTTNRRLGILVAERYGLAATGACSADQAVECLKQGNFAVVLLDLGVPKTAEGRGSLKRLLEMRRQFKWRVPIIAVTAYAAEQDRSECLAAGADDYLSKPYTLEQFAETVLPWIR